MKIGIIGAGNIGETLTRRLTAVGHDVAIANSRRTPTPWPTWRLRPAPPRSRRLTRHATPIW